MSDAAMKDCPFCSESIRATAIKCRYCGEDLDNQIRKSKKAPSAGERMLIPVGRPISAIAAGYCGLIALVPLLGIPFVIGGIITGVFALKEIKANPELSGAGRAWFGIIASAIGGMVSLVMLLALFLPRLRF